MSHGLMVTRGWRGLVVMPRGLPVAQGRVTVCHGDGGDASLRGPTASRRHEDGGEASWRRHSGAVLGALSTTRAA